MIANAVFVDTNILVYAHDRDAGPKHHRAREHVLTLWSSEIPPNISVQVLQELYVNLERKHVPLKEVHDIVADYLQWNVVDNDRDTFREALQFKVRWKLSLWDALIIAAAHQAGARTLWTEDLQPGQSFDGLVVVNPLLPE